MKRLLHTFTMRHFKILTAAAAVFLSAVMIILNLSLYQRYQQNLIEQEKNELLTMARTVGTSLQHHMKQEMSWIDLCMDHPTATDEAAGAASPTGAGTAGAAAFTGAETAGAASSTGAETAGAAAFTGAGTAGAASSTGAEAAGAASSADLEQIARQIVLQSNGLYTGCAGIRNGEIAFSFGEISYDLLSYAEKAGETASIVGKELNNDGWYEVLIGKTTASRVPCTVLFSMNLKKVYDDIVAPVRIGSGGYSVVKDSDLAIIMHHAKSQIGMDALYDREEAYPQLDLTSLKDWLDLQRRQEEGTGILESYVWDDPELTPVQRVVAYVTIDLGTEKWIVNSTLPVSDFDIPLQNMVFSMAVLSTVYLLAILLVCVAFMRMMGRSLRQRQEIEYLREINRGMELVARKNEEIRHYQRVQSMGMMSSHIAHEFNNYLTPVMLYGEMLETDETISEENRAMLREMLKSVGQAAKLSQDLLDFSRMDTGGKRRPVNLSEETEEAVSVVRQLVPAKITLHEEMSAQPAWLTGREGMIQHILMNLSKNAFHAMEDTEKKELTIRYEVSAETPGSSLAVLTVQDTGCGIRSEDMESIFEPFYTTKGSRQGTGLGLSVVRSLVENAGGTIEVQSVRATEHGQADPSAPDREGRTILDRGTAFIMTFPVTPEPPARRTDEVMDLFNSNHPADGAAKEHGAAGEHGGEGEHGRDGERTALSGAPSDPVSAPGQNNGQDGIVCICRSKKTLEPWRNELDSLPGRILYMYHEATLAARLQEQPDLCGILLIEETLTGMRGIELAQIIRRQNPDIRIVLLTGEENENLKWYLDNGVIDGILAKKQT